MYKKIRKFLFKLDPEKAHNLSLSCLKIVGKFPFILKKISKPIEDSALERELFGLKFKNPVGLAAGLDKNAKYYKELSMLGFGFIEIGTVTPRPQPGNEKKRLFRLVEDSAIINRMGFNNEGVEAVLKRLKKNTSVLIGGNIGKNTATPPEGYTTDYIECFEKLHPVVDYFTLNVSCPNVNSHAKLNDTDYLKELIAEIQSLNKTKEKQKPILLKISPDLTDEQLLDIIELVKETKIDGIIATNTTTSRENLISPYQDEKGGLSGKPLKERSTEVIRFLAKHSNKAFPIIGVGGIHSAKDALEKIEAGADLVQIYTGFIYKGPKLIRKINKAILKKYYKD
jgi:dihydroorotate oxidase